MSQEWLSNPRSNRAVLVRFTVTEFPTGNKFSYYFSSQTIFHDTAQHVIHPRLIGEARFNSELDVSTMRVTASWGAFEIDNSDHSFDYFLDYIWSGGEINAWIGDPQWDIDDFIPILRRGRIDAIEADERTDADILKVLVRNKLLEIDGPVTIDVIENGEREGTILPVVFGSPRNVSPPLIDSVHLRYQYHHVPEET